MNETSSYEYQEGAALNSGQPPPLPTAPGSTYRFSPDELRVLRECNNESFYQRSLPLGTALGFSTYAAIQRGFLNPSVRFGPFPKVTLAVIVGYFIGKVSYQKTCAEKLMALPGSYIGQLLRDKRDGKISNVPKQSTTMFGAGPNDIYSDAGPGNSLDLDTSRPLFSDETYRPDSEVVPPSAPEAQPSKATLSYEELRRRNRGEYNEARQDPYKVDTNVAPNPKPQRPPPQRSPPTNKYGDVID